MVGGGVLSLPYAFDQAGILVAFLFLFIIGVCADFTVYSLVSCSRRSGEASFEGVAKYALGPMGYRATLISVTITCFLAVVGYAVLLRDLLVPLYDRFSSQTVDNWDTPVSGNLLMVAVALLVTPLMFLDTLTALKPMGMVSCCTIFLLATSIAVRTCTCLAEDPDYSFITDPSFVPPAVPPTRDSMWKWLFPAGDYVGIINSLPILICTYVCHFNVLPVHHELHKPSRKRLKKLIHTTFLVTAAFYTFVGTFGMLVGNCPYYVLDEDGVGVTPQAVQGNILKNFPDDDNIITIGRLGLSCTITLAFPLLVVPCRDIVLRWLGVHLSVDAKADTLIKVRSTASLQSQARSFSNNMHRKSVSTRASNDISAPLLLGSPNRSLSHDGKTVTTWRQKLASTVTTLAIFWGGLMLACFVDDIAVVWDVLGSSISIFIAFIVPSMCYIVISDQRAKRREMKGMLHREREKLEKARLEREEAIRVANRNRRNAEEEAGNGGAAPDDTDYEVGIDEHEDDPEDLDRFNRVETIDLGDDGDDSDSDDSDTTAGQQHISLLSPSPFNRSRSVDAILKGSMVRRTFALTILCVFTPLMFLCTYNAVANLLANN
jgi:amino acid permease